MTTSRVVVGLCSDRTLMHAGLHAVAERFSSWLFVVPVESSTPIDIVVIDAAGRLDRDFVRVESMRRRGKGARVVMMVERGQNWNADVFADRVDAVIQHDASIEDIAVALRDIAAAPGSIRGAVEPSQHWIGREFGLSARQSEAVLLCATGMSNAEIARVMSIHVETVKSHLKMAFRLFGVHRRSELAVAVTKMTHTRIETEGSLRASRRRRDTCVDRPVTFS